MCLGVCVCVCGGCGVCVCMCVCVCVCVGAWVYTHTHCMYTVYINIYTIYSFTRVLQKVSALYFLKNLYLCYRHENRTTLLFNIISLLLDTFSSAICKLLNATGKQSLWLTAKPVMHCLFHLIISCKSTTS